MKELREEIEKILDSVGALATEFDENAKGFWIKYKTPEITDQILTLLEKEIQKAGINEVKKLMKSLVRYTKPLKVQVM